MYTTFDNCIVEYIGLSIIWLTDTSYFVYNTLPIKTDQKLNIANVHAFSTYLSFCKAEL